MSGPRNSGSEVQVWAPQPATRVYLPVKMTMLPVPVCPGLRLAVLALCSAGAPLSCRVARSATIDGPWVARPELKPSSCPMRIHTVNRHAYVLQNRPLWWRPFCNVSSLSCIDLRSMDPKAVQGLAWVHGLPECGARWRASALRCRRWASR